MCGRGLAGPSGPVALGSHCRLCSWLGFGGLGSLAVARAWQRSHHRARQRPGIGHAADAASCCCICHDRSIAACLAGRTAALIGCALTACAPRCHGSPASALAHRSPIVMAAAAGAGVGAGAAGSAATTMTSRIELFLEARGLPKLDTSSQTDAFAILYAKPVGPTGAPSATWCEIGRTTPQFDTATPRWATQFVLDYAFETVQPVRIVLWDFDSLSSHDYIGEGPAHARPHMQGDGPASARKGSHMHPPPSIPSCLSVCLQARWRRHWAASWAAVAPHSHCH